MKLRIAKKIINKIFRGEYVGNYRISTILYARSRLDKFLANRERVVRNMGKAIGPMKDLINILLNDLVIQDAIDDYHDQMYLEDLRENNYYQED